ncbi:MAG: hypothetical protein ACLFQM_01135 [Fidelibacterota bacterium]
MVKRIIILSLFLFLTNLNAYYFMNQRNHAEIDWKSLESENIIVAYHDPLLETAEEALQISEATYKSLVQTYDLELDEKIKIFITNQDKITNGYSAAGKYIAIWVDVNDYVNIFTGREKWLRKVLSHEISHHFVFHSVRTWADIFFPVTAMSFPSDFNEGYAMFFSGEEWGYGREDANLRKGIFSNDISYNHPDGFFYTTGFSMVRYLYEFYGMEKLQELLKYRNKFNLYSFKTAFKKVYGKSLKEFKEEWRQYVYAYYFGTAYEMKSSDGDTSAVNSLNYLDRIDVKGWKNFRSITMKDSLIFFQGKGNDKQYYHDLGIGYFNRDTLNNDTLEIKRIKKIEPVGIAQDLSISNNLRYCSYVKYERGKFGSILPKIHVYDIKMDKIEKITTGRLPQVDNRGGVYFQQLNHENNFIKYRQEESEETILTLHKSTAIGEMVLGPDGDKLALSQFDENHEFLLTVYSLSDKQMIHTDTLPRFPRKIFWRDRENLVITLPGEVDSRTVIKNINIKTGGTADFETPPYNVIAQQIEKTDSTHKAIVLAELDREKNRLLKVDLKDKSGNRYTPESNYYTRWIEARYPYPIEVPDTVPDYKKQNYNHLKNVESYINFIYPDVEAMILMTMWMDPLSRHMFTFSGYLEYDGMEPYYLINYVNRQLPVTIDLSYTKYIWLGGIWEDTWFTYDIENVGINFSKPLDIIKNSFVRFQVSTGLMYQDIKLREENFETRPIFEEGIAYTSESGLQLVYELPFKNSFVHPVRKYGVNYQLSMANSSLGMKKDFVEHDINFELDFAPLYDVFNLKVDNFIFTNKTNLNIINGNYFSQFQPGLDINENIPIGGGLITERQYLRGIDKTLVGNKLLVTKNEFWMKITDDLNFSVNLGAPLIDAGYLGIGLWTDYGKIWTDDGNYTFQTAGYEFKGVVNILGIPTIQRFGRAYNLDTEALDYYYQMNLPIDIGL